MGAEKSGFTSTVVLSWMCERGRRIRFHVTLLLAVELESWLESSLFEVTSLVRSLSLLPFLFPSLALSSALFLSPLFPVSFSSSGLRLNSRSRTATLFALLFRVLFRVPPPARFCIFLLVCT
jgi:hypothetical protein